MKKNLSRDKLNQVEVTFQDAIKYKDYKNIFESLKLIKDLAESVTESDEYQQLKKQAAFLVGATGAGKSTLMHYLMNKDLYLNKYDDIPGLYPKDEDGVVVGHGKGSTTLFPNVRNIDDVSYIDCAGEFDTSGSIGEVINAKIRSVMVKKVEQAKVLVVTPQSSIGASGAYGKDFKEMLDKYEFLKNMDSFLPSIGLVISHAGRMNDNNDTVKSLLTKIVQQNSLEDYTTSIQKIVGKKALATFAKYSEESEYGMKYEPPVWDKNQKANIQKIINDLEFGNILNMGIFNNSYSNKVKNDMSKAFLVVQQNGAELLTTMIKGATQPKLVVHAAELKEFVAFIDYFNTTQAVNYLSTYANKLQWNKFIRGFDKVERDQLKKLDQDLEFLAEFTDNKSGKCDWGNLIKVGQLFANMREDASELIHNTKSTALYSAFHSKKYIDSVGYSADFSQEIKYSMDNLYEIYIEKQKLEELGRNTNSKYFHDVQVSTPYTVSVPYTSTTSYTEYNVPYTSSENYTKHDVPYITKRVNGKKVDKVIKTKDIKKYENVKFKDVTYSQDVVKYKNETKYKDVVNYTTETRYTYHMEKQLNTSSYNSDLEKLTNKINELSKWIKFNLYKINDRNERASQEKAILPDKLKEIELKAKEQAALDKSNGSWNEFFKDINEQWKLLEYETCFLQNPDKSFNIEAIGNIPEESI